MGAWELALGGVTAPLDGPAAACARSGRTAPGTWGAGQATQAPRPMIPEGQQGRCDEDGAVSATLADVAGAALSGGAGAGEGDNAASRSSAPPHPTPETPP